LNALQGYRIYRSGVTSTTAAWRPLTVEAVQTQKIVADLGADDLYQFQIAAFTGVGDGPLSDPVQVVLRSAGARARRQTVTPKFHGSSFLVASS